MHLKPLIGLCIWAWLCLFSSPALAESPFSSTSSTRSAAIKWEIGYLALTAIDTIQTVDCFNRDVCEETNPLMGKNPSTQKLLIGRVLLSGLQFAVFKHMLDRNPKAALRYSQISVGVEGTVVALNAHFTF